MKDEIKVLEELKAFNENFFELYSRLNKYKKFIASEEQFRFMADKIFEQYKTQYELFRLKHERDEQRELYSEQLKNDALIPARRRRWLFGRRKNNRAAQLITEEVNREVEEFFAQEIEAIFLQYDSEPQQTTAEPEELNGGTTPLSPCVAEGKSITYTKGADLFNPHPMAATDPNGSKPVQTAESANPPDDSAPLAISEESPTVQEPAENSEPEEVWEIVKIPDDEDETPLEQIARVQEAPPKPKKSKQKKSGEDENVYQGDQT